MIDGALLKHGLRKTIDTLEHLQIHCHHIQLIQIIMELMMELAQEQGNATNIIDGFMFHFFPVTHHWGLDGSSGIAWYGGWNNWNLVRSSGNQTIFTLKFKVNKNGRAKLFRIYSLADRWSWLHAKIGPSDSDWTHWKRVVRHGNYTHAEISGPIEYVIPSHFVNALTDANDFITLQFKGDDGHGSGHYWTFFEIEDYFGEYVQQ